MGQKSHPYALRLGYIKGWKAKWFKSKGFSKQLLQDIQIRKFVKERLQASGVADIEIERSQGTIRLYIHTARPGIIIGRRGAEIDRLRDDLKSMAGDEVQKIDIKIVEVKVPQIDAQLVAENVAQQLEKRVAFRKAMKKAVIMAMSKGAKGAKIIVGGRLGGSEIARSEKYMEGSLPLSTFRADIDFGFTEALTTYGKIGVKVWVYKGDILVKKKEAEEALQKESQVTDETAQEETSNAAHAQKS